MTDRNGNKNCLEGYACPQCGEHKMLKVCMVTMMELFDNGTGDHEDTEWDENSHVDCPNCGYGGPSSKFKIVDIVDQEDEDENVEGDAASEADETAAPEGKA